MTERLGSQTEESRATTDPQAPPGAPASATRPQRPTRALILLAVWFGLTAGLSEVALRGTQLLLGQRIALSPQFVWMAPLADLALYGLVGLVVAAVARAWPRRVGAGTLAFLATFILVAAPLHMLQQLHGAAVLLLAIGVAAQVARVARRHPQRLQRVVRATLLPMGAAVLLLALGLNGWLRLTERRQAAALPAAAAAAPNVLLIILDTVRAASLRLYGYDRETAPNLARLASDGIIFDRAIAPAPWTLPSHASMFTGQPAERLDADWKTRLGETEPTIAEVLADHGYRTGGFSGNLGYVTYETGLARGFLRFEDYPISPAMVMVSSFPGRIVAQTVRRLAGSYAPLVSRSATALNGSFLGWLDAKPADRPFFAFLNYFDAHDPYLPVVPFDTLYGGIHAAPPLSLNRPWTQDQLDRSRDAYDAAIAYVDHELGVLLAELERRELLESTIVIVASDHGEHFGEHGLLYHANSLYMTALHVPLVIRRPGGDGGRRFDEPVSLTDLPATIVGLARLPADRIPGVSLIDASGNPRAGRPARASVSETINMASWLPASQGDMMSTTGASLHYILNGDGREELYDYVADPDETRNLAEFVEFRNRLKRMRGIAADEPAEPSHPNAGGSDAGR